MAPKASLMFEAVLFDLDGTLKISVPNGMAVFVDYAVRLGVPIDDRAARAGARWNHWYWANSPALREDLALQDEGHFWTRYSLRLLEAVGVSEPAEVTAQAITAQFAGYAPEIRLNDGAQETLTGLKQAGYTLGLVSNRRDPLDGAVADLGLEGFFAFTLAAGEVDVWKPDPGIFDLALARGCCRPATSIYVGDNYYADVVSARAAGLTPVLLDPDGVFPEAECKVIGGLTELLSWLVG